VVAIIAVFMVVLSTVEVIELIDNAARLDKGNMGKQADFDGTQSVVLFSKGRCVKYCLSFAG
jgi:hypothetical protein